MTTTSAMNPMLRAAIASTILALAIGSATTANAGSITLDPAPFFNTIPMSPVGSSSVSNGNTGGVSPVPPLTEYDTVNVSTGVNLAGATYDSYFGVSNPTSVYQNTTWSIWVTGKPGTPGCNAFGYCELYSNTVKGTFTITGASPSLVSAISIPVLVNGMAVHLAPGTYYIGFENNLTNTKTLSNYAWSGKAADLISVVAGNPKVGPVATAELKQAAFALYAEEAPEPSTWAMMIMGFAGLTWLGRRRLRARAKQQA